MSQLEDERGLQAVAGPDMLVLRTPVQLDGEDLRTEASFLRRRIASLYS
jgi:hypothetical protein